VNRLSDFLYVLARDANKEVKEQQPIYKYME
jgi:cob(I)alamin adenosyltransferase